MASFLISVVDNDYYRVVREYVMEFKNREGSEKYCRELTWSGHTYYCREL